MALSAVPVRPSNVNPRIVSDFTKQSVVGTIAGGYTSSQLRVLSNTVDEVEREISYKAYDRMENDSTMHKSKRILVNGVLSDDLQMVPGATEENVGPEEYDLYVQILELCERAIDGLDGSLKKTLEQHFGNAIKYGHGVAEVEYEYRKDAPSSKPVKNDQPKGKIQSLFGGFSSWWKGGIWAAEDTNVPNSDFTRPVLTGEKIRLMPKSIKVKPRNATRFVVDDYMNILGLLPTNLFRSNLQFNEVLDRRKFLILTLNKKDEDPRGTSAYRPAFNWYNLKTQIPAEIMRFILEESVPKAVGTMSENMPPFEFERDEDGNIIYNDPDTKKDPRMLTGAESFKRQIEGFRSGSGAVIPHGATLEPYKKGLTGSGDAEIFNKLITIIDNQMEEAILHQTLAQSEGQHQARSASQQVAEILYNLIFWSRWELAEMLIYDLFTVVIEMNIGSWAVKYMPIISFGDFMKRDWVTELETYADAYFKGLLDDTQRPEIMANLNLPKPGPSRQELGLEAAAKQDVNGQPVQPNSNRGDKNAGAERNNGNGTEKKNNVKQNFRRGNVNNVGHHTGWFGRFTSNIRQSRR